MCQGNFIFVQIHEYTWGKIKKKINKVFSVNLCNHDGSLSHLPIFCTILLVLSALTIRPEKSDMIYSNKIQAVWKCLFIFSTLMVATLIFTTWKFDAAKSLRKEKATQELFVYLTQTESCLRTSLILNLDLGNRSKCRCDVVVLSYKAKRPQRSPGSLHLLVWQHNRLGIRP